MTAANSRADKNVLQLYLCCTLGPNVSSKVHSRTIILRMLLSQQRGRLTNSWSKIYWFFGSHFFKELESMVVWFWNGLKNQNRRFFIISNNHTILKIIRKWNSSAPSCTPSVVQYGLIRWSYWHPIENPREDITLDIQSGQWKIQFLKGGFQIHWRVTSWNCLPPSVNWLLNSLI
jgi:hypothetical protein